MRKNPGKAAHLRRAKAKLESARGQYRSVQAAGSGEAGFRQEILLLAHMTAAQAVQEAANAGATTVRDDAYHLQQLIEGHLSRLRTPGKTNPGVTWEQGAAGWIGHDLDTGYSFRARKTEDGNYAYTVFEPGGRLVTVGETGSMKGVKKFAPQSAAQHAAKRAPAENPKRRRRRVAPQENPSVRRFADYPVAKRDAARKAKRTDTTHYVYELSQNPKFAVMSGDHPVQQSYESGVIGLGKAKLRHTERAPAPNPEDDEDDSGLTPIPPHIKIKRLPPGRAQWAGLPHEGHLAYPRDDESRPVRPHGTDPIGTSRGSRGRRKKKNPARKKRRNPGRLTTRPRGLRGPDEVQLADAMNAIIWEQTGAMAIGTDESALNLADVARELELYRESEKRYWREECGNKADLGEQDCVDTMLALAALEYFDSLPLEERLRWIATVVEEARTERGLRPNPSTSRRRRKKNPYETKGRTTVAGLGLHKDEHTYRGHRIKIAPYGGRAKGLIGGFLAAVTPGDLGNQFSPDRDSALELARLLIDRNEYVQSLNAVDRRRFEDLDEVMRWFTTSERHPLTREHVARQIEDYRRGEVVDWEDECAQEEDPYKSPAWWKDDDCVDTWKILKSFEFFDALPLSDRLRWVDSVVKEARLRRGLPAHNPGSDDEDKKKAKKILKGLTPIPEHITIQRLPPGPVPKKSLMPGEGPRARGVAIGKTPGGTQQGGSGGLGGWVRPAAAGPGPHGNPRRKKKKSNPDRRAIFRRMMRL